MRRAPRSAHTLLELLVSLAILGVLLAVVRFNPPKRATTDGTRDIRTCQRRAIIERREVIQTTSQGFVLCTADGRVSAHRLEAFTIVPAP